MRWLAFTFVLFLLAFPVGIGVGAHVPFVPDFEAPPVGAVTSAHDEVPLMNHQTQLESQVAEPAAMWVMGLGMVGVAFFSRRR